MTATVSNQVTYSGAFNFAFIRFTQDAADPNKEAIDAGNIHAVQTDGPGNNANVTVSLTGHSANFDIDWTRVNDGPNRGDYNIRAGNSLNDTTNGIFIASVAVNGVDNHFGQGTEYAVATMGYRSDNSVFASINRAPDGAESNGDIAAANFDFTRYVGAWVRNDGQTVQTAGIGTGKIHVTKNGDYTYTVKIDGVDSSKDGVLMVTGADNKPMYAAARPLADGSGWVVGVHNDMKNGYSYDDEDFGFSYIPKGNKLVTFGRVLSDGSSAISNGNYHLDKTGTGEYKLTIDGVLPKDGALILSAEGLDGANIDNIVSYQPTAEGDGWIIQTRDIPSMQLEDAGLSAHPEQYIDLDHAPNPIYVGTAVDKIVHSYQTADDGNNLVAAHRMGYWQDDHRILAENSMAAVERSISIGVDIVETDLQRTKDGHWVLMHDTSVNRTTTGSGNISDMTLDQVRALNLKIEGTNEVTSEKVPTLEELFSAIKGHIMVNLDKLPVSYIPEVAAIGEAMGVNNQLIYKSAVQTQGQLDEVIAALKASPDGLHFMPIFQPGIDLNLVEKIFQQLPVDAVEINVAPDSTGAVTDPGFFFTPDMKALFDKYDVRYFINTLYDGQGNSSGPMSGGLGDFQGLERPDLVYGYWADQGVSIFQTDESKGVVNYLNDNGYRVDLDAINSAPVLGAAPALEVHEDADIGSLDLLAHVTDAEGDAISITKLDSLPEGVTYDAATHTLTIDPKDAAFQHLAAGVSEDVHVSYTVTDGTNEVATSATFTVVGTNDAPVVQAEGLTIAENAAGVEVASLDIVDPDSTGFTFRVVDANGIVDDRFEIVEGADGKYEVVLKAGVSLDYEAASTITRTVEATDDAGNAAATGHAEFTVHVTDVNENPGNPGNGGGGGEAPGQPSGGQGPQTPTEGTAGNDKLVSTSGDDTFNAGAGKDTVVYSSDRSAYTIETGSDGLPTKVSGPDGKDTLSGVEYLSFKDGVLAFQTDKNTDLLVRLYDTAFNRQSDKGGITANHMLLETGKVTVQAMASAYADSAEFKATFGSAVTNEQFVKLMYHNAFDRDADAGGLKFWTDGMDSGHFTRADVLLGFADSNEEVGLIAPVLAKGVFFDSSFVG